MFNWKNSRGGAARYEKQFQKIINVVDHKNSNLDKNLKNKDFIDRLRQKRHGISKNNED